MQRSPARTHRDGHGNGERPRPAAEAGRVPAPPVPSADLAAGSDPAARMAAAVHTSPRLVAQRERLALLRSAAEASRIGETVAGPVAQLAFHPHRTAGTTHLERRHRLRWRTVGGQILAGTEVVVDREQQRTRGRGDARAVWSKAVNVTGARWVAGFRQRDTYIPDADVGARNVYPTRHPAAKPPGQPVPVPETRWSETQGEYFPRRELRAALVQRARDILWYGTRDVAWGNLLATDENVERLVANPGGGGSKALRLDEGQRFRDPVDYLAWYRWLEGPFARIEQGADDVRQSLEHWRRTLRPHEPERVRIRAIRLTGSDLHEHGLGALFVTFEKPVGPRGHPFEQETNFTVVVKPEHKELERNLFGAQFGSAAHEVNFLAALDDERAITTFRMETHRLYGSLIELVGGRELGRNEATAEASPALREAMVFAALAGIGDLHYENVLWDDGTPYFIDADNALVHRHLRVEGGTQSGFTRRSEAVADLYAQLRDHPEDLDSEIMEWMLNPVLSIAEPVIEALRGAFAGQKGRAVPIFTRTWANILKHIYIRRQEGQEGQGIAAGTRWGHARGLAAALGTGTTAAEPGLEGETGTAPGGGHLDVAEATRQVKADFDRGQIPFFTYEFDTGLVRHNGQEIWHGRTLAQALQGLIARYGPGGGG